MCVYMQVYLQHIKLEDAGDTDINVQLDRLLQLSDFYASSWQELLNVPPDNIVRGTKLCLISQHKV